jgi:hypothetical protein
VLIPKKKTDSAKVDFFAREVWKRTARPILTDVIRIDTDLSPLEAGKARKETVGEPPALRGRKIRLKICGKSQHEESMILSCIIGDYSLTAAN